MTGYENGDTINLRQPLGTLLIVTDNLYIARRRGTAWSATLDRFRGLGGPRKGKALEGGSGKVLMVVVVVAMIIVPAILGAIEQHEQREFGSLHACGVNSAISSNNNVYHRPMGEIDTVVRPMLPSHGALRTVPHAIICSHSHACAQSSRGDS